MCGSVNLLFIKLWHGKLQWNGVIQFEFILNELLCEKIIESKLINLNKITFIDSFFYKITFFYSLLLLLLLLLFVSNKLIFILLLVILYFQIYKHYI